MQDGGEKVTLQKGRIAVAQRRFVIGFWSRPIICETWPCCSRVYVSMYCTTGDQNRLIPWRHCRMILRRNVELVLNQLDMTGNGRKGMEREREREWWVLQSRLIDCRSFFILCRWKITAWPSGIGGEEELPNKPPKLPKSWGQREAFLLLSELMREIWGYREELLSMLSRGGTLLQARETSNERERIQEGHSAMVPTNSAQRVL